MMLIYESHASISHIKIALYNPMNIFFGLSLEKTDHVIQKIGRTFSETIFAIRFDICCLVLFRGIKAQKTASVQAKLLFGHRKQEITFCRSQ